MADPYPAWPPPSALVMADPHPGRATSVWHLLVGPPRYGPGQREGADHPGRGPLGPLARRPDLGGLRARGHHPRPGGGRRRGPAPRPAHHDRHRRPPGHPGVLLPPGHRRLPDGRRRLRRLPGQPRRHTPASWPRRRWSSTTRSPSPSPSPPASPSLQSAFPGLDGATVPLCLGILLFITVLNLRGLGETARAFLLPTMVFIVGLLAIIAIGLIHPLGLNEPQLGHVAAADDRAQGGDRPARPQGLLGRLQRADRRRGDRQRGAALPGAPGRPGQADRDAARAHPRRHAARPGRPGQALADRSPDAARRC